MSITVQPDCIHYFTGSACCYTSKGNRKVSTGGNNYPVTKIWKKFV
jgi:hypothetical protein